MPLRCIALPAFAALTLQAVGIHGDHTFAAASGSYDSQHAVHWDSGGMDFAWDATHAKSEYIDSGAFDVNKTIITGIKVASKGEIFVTVPRWFAGVPSTLNKVALAADGSTAQNPVLTPWPSWDMNAIGGDCSGLQYLQSMEIDNDGIMWALDVGLVNTIGGPVDTTCPPKMVFIDTQTGDTVGDPYIFPDSVFSHTSGFPNDLVIDNAAQVAYISDTSPEGNGAIIVFDRSDRKSRRFHDDTMKPDTTGDIDWSSVNYPQGTAGFQATPQDGIALTPDGKRVYFTALGAVGMYSLSAMALRQHCKFCLLVLLFCLATVLLLLVSGRRKKKRRRANMVLKSHDLNNNTIDFSHQWPETTR